MHAIRVVSSTTPTNCRIFNGIFRSAVGHVRRLGNAGDLLPNSSTYGGKRHFSSFLSGFKSVFAGDIVRKYGNSTMSQNVFHRLTPRSTNNLGSRRLNACLVPKHLDSTRFGMFMNEKRCLSTVAGRSGDEHANLDELIGLVVCLIAIPYGISLYYDRYLGSSYIRDVINQAKVDILGSVDRVVVSPITQRAMDWYYSPHTYKLLPPMLPPPYDRPITLVVPLENVLAARSGPDSMPRKRKGVIFFLEYLSQFVEIVLTTEGSAAFLSDILPNIDPRGAISYHLTADSLSYRNGKVVKDIDLYDRDPHRTVVLETPINYPTLQQSNCITIPPWTGNENDQSLLYLAGMVRQLAVYSFQNPKTDLRPLIAAIGQYGNLDEQLSRVREGEDGGWLPWLVSIVLGRKTV